MSSYKELLLGCGSRRVKHLFPAGGHKDWQDLTTLDINEAHKPDVVRDLEVPPLPWADNTFDEIHAYEVLEHIGAQGNAWLFFTQFADYWRILKPNGWFFATVPAADSPWLWGDPSHSRAILPQTLIFLSQQMYKDNVGQNPMSDFRYMYKADFEVKFQAQQNGIFAFGLQAIKPSRYEENK